jgi:predicted membrane metal-binding protein
MGLLSYYILMMGRQSDALALLLFTALVLVLFNPLSLNYDISLHLSFLAVLGLLYFQDFWRKMCLFLPQFFAIRESFVLTLAAMTPTLPVMIFTF